MVAVYDSIWKDVEMVCQNVKGRDDSYSHSISLFLSSYNSLRKKEILIFNSKQYSHFTRMTASKIFLLIYVYLICWFEIHRTVILKRE